MADPAALSDIMPSANINGWTAARQKRFLEAIAEGSSVTVACAFVSLSTTSAYAFRRRAKGRAFDRVWRAADLLARERVAAELMERAQEGQIVETTRPDGSVVTRHYHDNRLALQLLARLDRYADASEGTGPGREAREIAADFDTYLDLIGQERAPTRAAPFRLPDEDGNGDGDTAGSDDTPARPATAATPPADAAASPDRHPAGRDAAPAHRSPEPCAATQAYAATRQPVTTPDAPTRRTDPEPAPRESPRPEPYAAAEPAAAPPRPVTAPDTPTPRADGDSPLDDRRLPEPCEATQADPATRQPVTTPDHDPTPRTRTWADTAWAKTNDAGRQPVTTSDDIPARLDDGDAPGDGYDEGEEEYDVFDYRNYLPGARRPEHPAAPPVQTVPCRCDHGLAL